MKYYFRNFPDELMKKLRMKAASLGIKTPELIFELLDKALESEGSRLNDKPTEYVVVDTINKPNKADWPSGSVALALSGWTKDKSKRVIVYYLDKPGDNYLKASIELQNAIDRLC